MKIMKFATLSFTVLLYSAIALAQHGHAGGTGVGAGSGMGNGDAAAHGSGSADHGIGNGSSGTLASARGKTVNNILNNNTQLADKISKLTNEPATTACANFKNLGQCVAAAHVAKNLGITFDCLKDDMLGVAPANATSCPAGTGTKGTLSLGKSIQALEPSVDSGTASKKGQSQAAQDLKGA